MDEAYICSHLKRLIKTLKQVPIENTFARLTEEGFYTFGTRKPLTRNTVTRQIAIYLIAGTLDKNN